MLTRMQANQKLQSRTELVVRCKPEISAGALWNVVRHTEVPACQPGQEKSRLAQCFKRTDRTSGNLGLGA
jgi:hypothetical protein